MQSQADVSLPETPLSLAIDNLIVQWTQLLAQIPTSVGMVQPTEDHIKESAEIIIRQFRDSCLNANGEFARTAMEWRLRHPDQVVQEEICDLESSIQRQQHLLTKINERCQEIEKTSKREDT